MATISRADNSEDRLPTDLYLSIIDVLGEANFHALSLSTISTLTHCALVCRSWRARSQFWLFRCIYVDNVEQLRKLAAVLDAVPSFALNVIRIRLPLITTPRYQTQCLLSSLPTVLGKRLPS